MAVRFSVRCETEVGDRVFVVGSHAELGVWNPEASEVELCGDSSPLWRGEWTPSATASLESHVSDCQGTSSSPGGSPRGRTPPPDQRQGAKSEPVFFKFVVRRVGGAICFEDHVGDRKLSLDAAGCMEVSAEFDREGLNVSVIKAMSVDECLAALGSPDGVRKVITESIGATTIEDLCILADTSLEDLGMLARHLLTPVQLLVFKNTLQCRARVLEVAGPLPERRPCTRASSRPRRSSSKRRSSSRTAAAAPPTPVPSSSKAPSAPSDAPQPGAHDDGPIHEHVVGGGASSTSPFRDNGNGNGHAACTSGLVKEPGKEHMESTSLSSDAGVRADCSTAGVSVDRPGNEHAACDSSSSTEGVHYYGPGSEHMEGASGSSSCGACDAAPSTKHMACPSTSSTSGMRDDGPPDVAERSLTPHEKIQRTFVHYLRYDLGHTSSDFTWLSCYQAVALSVRDRLTELLKSTNAWLDQEDHKRCYYLSAEYLTGRCLQNALASLQLEGDYGKALRELGIPLEELYACEAEPALGDSSRGRRAACLLDACATQDLPVSGYGLRYADGLFRQAIVDGHQVEVPDDWLETRSCFEVCREDVVYEVHFYGYVEHYEENCRECSHWHGEEVLKAMAYDMPVPGYGTKHCISVRLWRALPSAELDVVSLLEGVRHTTSGATRRVDELNSFLYPEDGHDGFDELRLRQEYLFCSASMQDILRSFKRKHAGNWDLLPQKVQVQLNDTHPWLSVPELMRLLVDVEGLDAVYAWKLTKATFNYTNYAVTPVALEMWDLGLLAELLPRHVELVDLMDRLFLEEVEAKWGDGEWLQEMSMWGHDEQGEFLRAGNLAVISSRHVSGLGMKHTESVKNKTFERLYKWSVESGEPGKFVNCTSGISSRRWLHCANPSLSSLITETIGSDAWIKDSSRIRSLVKYKNNREFQAKWLEAGNASKDRMAQWVKEHCGLDVDSSYLIDVQIEHIREDERQLMNVFYQIYRYLEIKSMLPADRRKVQKRFSCIGGQAAIDDCRAKSIIKLVNNVAKVINGDPDVSPLLKLAFLPDCGMSVQQQIVPASDTSQHLAIRAADVSSSLAAAVVINGGLTVTAREGAHATICKEAAGDAQPFLFGAQDEEEDRELAYNDMLNWIAGWSQVELPEEAKLGRFDARLGKVFAALREGRFSCGDDAFTQEMCTMLDELCNATEAGEWDGDRYLVCRDFPSYVEAQERVDQEYKSKVAFVARSISAACSSGTFSADRSVTDYAKLVWELPKCPRPAVADITAPEMSWHGWQGG